jgi:hypothetical protein
MTERIDRAAKVGEFAAFIDRGDLKDTFAIAARLLADRHDLIQPSEECSVQLTRDAGFDFPRNIEWAKAYEMRRDHRSRNQSAAVVRNI